MDSDYAKAEWDGQNLQRWMESANVSGCYVNLSDFNWTDIETEGWTKVDQPECLPVELVSYAKDLGLPEDTLDPDHSNSPYRYVLVMTPGSAEEPLSWIGRVGKGVIFMDVIFRSNNSPLYIGELTKAIYEHKFPLESLMHVFVTCVVNEHTVDCVKRICLVNGLDYPPTGKRTWEGSSSEFSALLGTKIGKSVARFILCAYGQGVKRITRVVICSQNFDGEFDMRFDIEDVV